MNEHSLEVLSQYEISVEKTARGRGTYLIWSDKSIYQLFEYNGTDTRLGFLRRLLTYIVEAGFENVDILYETKEGELYSKDYAGNKYILKKYFNGRECDIKKNSDILSAVEALANIHNLTSNIKDEELRGYDIMSPSLIEQYGKHNREMKRVRTYIRNKNRRTRFEYDILHKFDEYYEYASQAYNSLIESDYLDIKKQAIDALSICHGTYNHHNIVMCEDSVAVINFDHANINMQLEDLYFFFRKLMEKHDWDVNLGNEIIDKYSGIRPINDKEWKIFKVMLMYPEKYWKILNRYSNSRKSWIPDKNESKLQAVYDKQQKKMNFIKEIWS